jgi:hypothetical protein
MGAGVAARPRAETATRRFNEGLERAISRPSFRFHDGGLCDTHTPYHAPSAMALALLFHFSELH